MNLHASRASCHSTSGAPEPRREIWRHHQFQILEQGELFGSPRHRKIEVHARLDEEFPAPYGKVSFGEGCPLIGSESGEQCFGPAQEADRLAVPAECGSARKTGCAGRERGVGEAHHLRLDFRPGSPRPADRRTHRATEGCSLRGPAVPASASCAGWGVSASVGGGVAVQWEPSRRRDRPPPHPAAFPANPGRAQCPAQEKPPRRALPPNRPPRGASATAAAKATATPRAARRATRGPPLRRPPRSRSDPRQPPPPPLNPHAASIRPHISARGAGGASLYPSASMARPSTSRSATASRPTSSSSPRPAPTAATPSPSPSPASTPPHITSTGTPGASL